MVASRDPQLFARSAVRVRPAAANAAVARSLAHPALLFALLGAGLLVAALALGGCGDNSADSPYELFDPGFTIWGGTGTGGSAGAGGGGDPTIGGPCTDDEQCDDQVDCTFDGCDHTIERCRFVPDDSACQNGLFCDGVERCHNQLGCRLGVPVTCSDGNPCIINTCDEASKLCIDAPRDADQDGDPDGHCPDGDDCDDQDPYVSSLQPEVCGNGRDDDCDDEVDEASCVSPAHDTCLDPLEITAPGTYGMSSVAANLDYGASCSVANPAQARDVVAAIMLAAGPLVDVQLTARTADDSQADVALALLGQCGSPATEIACSGGFPAPGGGRIAKLRGRSLGDPQAAQALPAYVFTDQGVDFTLRLELLEASSPPVNETCGTAAPLVPAVPVEASIIDAAVDLASGCSPNTGELVYEFVLAQSFDVDLYASSIDGDGEPMISLRSAACALPEDEITCRLGGDAHIFRHSLPAGTYYVAVAASAPTDVLLTLELSPPTAPPPDEDCVNPPEIPHNQTIDVALDQHQDDVNTGCLPAAVDAVYELVLTEDSDVLLVGRRSQGDAAAVALVLPACGDAADEIACGLGTLSPVRARARNVPAGSYRVVAESQHGAPMQLTALVRPAVPPTVVPFADDCAEVLTIPSTGGFLQGNSANAAADYIAGCDQGGQPAGGAPEQLLELVLGQTKRVVLDMQGSGYPTLLNVREGASCPGTEISGACAVGYYPERSYLDLELPAGTYYLQVDGYAGQSGPWFLDAHAVDP